MAAHRRFKQFRINEISAVDNPAQKGARALIMKRAEALTPEELAAEIKKSVGALVAVYDEIHADDAAIDKQALLQESFDQFKGHIQGIVPEGIENAMAALALSEAGFVITEGGALSKREEDHMAFDIKKHLGLPATATDADIQKAMDERDAAGTHGRNIAKMSGDHLAYMKNKDAHLPAGGVQEFAAMTPEARDAIMKEWPAMSAEDKKKAKDKADADAAADAKKRAEGDEVLKVDGTEIRKSVVGESVFAVMKSQQAAIEKGADREALATFTKRAEPLPHIGKSDEIGGLLHSIAKHDPKIADAVEKKFTQLETMIAKGALFNEIGKGGDGQIGKAADSIEAAAQALIKSGQAKTIFKARTMARDQNPDLAKQEEEERKASQKRAA